MAFIGFFTCRDMDMIFSPTDGQETSFFVAETLGVSWKHKEVPNQATHPHGGAIFLKATETNMV